MQSRRWSLIETFANTLSGFLLAMLTNYLLLPQLFGIKPSLIGNLAYTVVFTIISLVRGYAWRRFFNWLYIRFGIK